MLLDLTPDQEFLRETTARFLDDQAPVGALRALRDDARGFDPDYWRRGADLGWTSLLVDEQHGGGTVSGAAAVDLTLLAYEFGRHAAPGPLVTTNLVAAALSATDSHLDVLGEVLAGAHVAAWAHAEPRPHDRLGEVAVTITADGDSLVVHGVKRPVESAGVAGHFLVTGRTGSGLTQVLVPSDTPGVTVVPMGSVDLTRRFGEVRFDQVRLPVDAAVGQVAGADAQVDHQLQLALVMVTAESVGTLQTVLDMTVEWAFDRYSFGRPLASYQALKHRFADMTSWLQGAHAIADSAAVAVDQRSAKADDLLSAAKAFIGTYGGELMQDCVQLHGGIGVTFEHDIHLYLRRHTVDTALFGTPSEHRQRLCALAETREDAA